MCFELIISVSPGAVACTAADLVSFEGSSSSTVTWSPWSHVSSLELVPSVAVSRPCQSVLGDYRGAIFKVQAPGYSLTWWHRKCWREVTLGGCPRSWLLQCLPDCHHPLPHPHKNLENPGRQGARLLLLTGMGAGLGLGLSHLSNVGMKGRKDGESAFVHYKAYLTATPNWREGSLENKQLESWDSS